MKQKQKVAFVEKERERVRERERIENVQQIKDNCNVNRKFSLGGSSFRDRCDTIVCCNILITSFLLSNKVDNVLPLPSKE